MKPHTTPIWAIVLHHTEALPYTFEQVRALHLKERGWEEIAYHFFIGWGGEVRAGRPLDMQGTHALGRNNGTIGVCLEGNFLEGQPTIQQAKALVGLLRQLQGAFPGAAVLTHKEIMSFQVGNQRPKPNHTDCPGGLSGEVIEWLAGSPE